MQAPQHCIPVSPAYEPPGGLNSKRAREEDDCGGQRHEGEGFRAMGGDGGVLDILATRAVEESRAVGQSDEVVTLQQCKVRAMNWAEMNRAATRPYRRTRCRASLLRPVWFSRRGGLRALD
jgi:hypothetical protein